MKQKPVLLIVDDDRSTREGLERALKYRYDIYVAESAERALEILSERPIEAMLSDIRMPGMDGLALLQRALTKSPQPVCILMTAYGSIDRAVEAIKHGAADYVTKPYNLDDLEIRLNKAIRSRSIESENVRLQEQLDDRYGMDSIIGNSAPMDRLADMIKQAAPTRATVMLQGESGTGKELAAHAIHRLSTRTNGPFIAVHCAALSQNLMESELFGHEKGAFTGAHERRTGRFEMANGGTLFLDEVSEIDKATQTKLLRVLDERCFERVGGTQTVDVDIRLIGATNRNLKEMVDNGEFRNDLYFRMNVINIELPPLRSRTEDVPLLCDHFIRSFNEEHSKNIKGITAEAVSIMSSYPWPGNVRELRNIIEKMVILSRGPKLTAGDIPPDILGATGRDELNPGWAGMGAAPTSMEEAEKLMMIAALKKQHGNRTKAAEQLGMSRRTFHRRLNQYGISTQDPESN